MTTISENMSGGMAFQYEDALFTSREISILDIRPSDSCLIFKMGISIPGDTVFKFKWTQQLLPAYVIIMVTDAMVLNRHADAMITSAQYEHIMSHVYHFTSMKQIILKRGWTVANMPFSLFSSGSVFPSDNALG